MIAGQNCLLSSVPSHLRPFIVIAHCTSIVNRLINFCHFVKKWYFCSIVNRLITLTEGAEGEKWELRFARPLLGNGMWTICELRNGICNLSSPRGPLG